MHKLVKRLGAIGVVAVLGMFAAIPRVDADTIVLGDIEYTSDGSVDDEARNAIQTYLQFSLSRLLYGKPQTVTEYIRECRSDARVREPDGSCVYPDFLIQVQIAEREGEVQMSAAVGRKTEPRKLRPYNLDPIRVKTRDLTEGLSRVAKGIQEIIRSTAAGSTERVNIVIACFELGSEQSGGPRAHAGSASVMSTVSDYAKRLPRALEAFLRDQPGIAVSTNKDANAECGSLEGKQAIAKMGNADALLSGRVFTDDKSGIVVLSYILIVGASKQVALPAISVQRGAYEAAFVTMAGNAENAPNPVVASSNDGEIDSVSYLLVAQKVGAIAKALVGSNRSKFVKAIENGSEVSYYVDQAKHYLSSSRSDYEAADALLDLAIWTAPAEPQAYLLRASSLSDRRRHKMAATVLQSGIDQVSNPKALYSALAENFVRTGDLPEARRVYEKALSAKALASEEAWLGIAKTYLAARPPERALAMQYALKATEEQNAFSVDAYSLAGQIALANSDVKDAEKYFQEGIKISPTSPELASKLSSLYEHLGTQESINRNPRAAIDYLTKSIDVSPSVGKYYDRAGEYMKVYANSDERAKGYLLASTDYKAARQKARGSVLAQFPWLMPNLIETLIFEGKFPEAKQIAQEFFEELGGDSLVRPSIDPKDLHLIAAFLNATAELLDTGSADKEQYLFENAKLGRQFGRLSWSFAEMLRYLDGDYPKIRPQLDPNEREKRVTAVMQWISQLRGQ